MSPTNMGVSGGIMPSSRSIELADEKRDNIDVEAPEVGGASPNVYFRENWGLAARVDPSVTFEEYSYWANIERERERQENAVYVQRRGPASLFSLLKDRFSKGIHHENKKEAERQAAEAEKNGAVVSDSSSGAAVSDEEWRIAARALRTSGWGTVFYLITTDILGWGSTPNVYSSAGFGLSTGLYIIFGIAAWYSGYMLWKVFLGLDSARFPMVSYGDTFFRVYGAKSRHFINVTQSIQQFMTVAVLTLGSGSLIGQLSNESICYIVCILIFAIFGAIVGNIRSLQRIGWLANASVWMNIVSFIIVLAAAYKYAPDYQYLNSSTLIKGDGPVKTFGGKVPNEYQESAYGFAAVLTGVNNLVYSYGGALLFVAFLAEMRHPLDFWKGLTVAMAFISCVYIIFGALVYSQMGQYSASTITQAITPKMGLQTVSNVFALLTGAIACLMYMNIGMKTVYVEVFEEVLHFPALVTKRGRIWWTILGPFYWALAFVVGASVPSLFGISSIVGALLILNFTYTFPPMVFVGFMCQIGAVLPGEGFDPATGVTTRHDTGMTRWVRGFKKYWFINSINVVYAIAALACSALGSYGAIQSLIQLFGPGGTVATSWGCAVPA